MIQERLNQIQARADDATEGPWWGSMISGHVEVFAGTGSGSDPMLATGMRPGDAEFIAAARTDVPWLVAAVRRHDDALRAVLDLHKPMTMYEHEDACEDTSDEHREERHVEGSASYGEFFCLDLPTGVVLCAECSRDLDFDGRDYPCPTVRTITAALGENTP